MSVRCWLSVSPCSPSSAELLEDWGLTAELVHGGFSSVLALEPPGSDDGWPVTLSDPRERRGQEVFDQRCAACHGEVPDSSFGPAFLPPMPGTQALRRRYGEVLPALLEERTDLSAEYIEAVVRDGLGSMPFFRPTELSRDDLEALVAYLTRPLVQE